MHTKRTVRWSIVAAAAATATLLLAGCAPGSSQTPAASSSQPTKVKTDVASLGKITLTVWDQETTPGISDSLDALNKQFEEKYPNVTIDRVVRSGSDLRTTLKLALSSANTPDAVQANQGFADMAAYVKAGRLTNLAAYAKAYDWSSRFPSSQLALDSVTSNGSQLGSGNLYGISITGEMVGTFYNKKVLDEVGIPVPKSMAELKADLPKIKAKGVLPIAFGDQDKSPAVHLLGATLMPSLGQSTASQLVFHQSGSFDSPKVTKTAQMLADWAKKGYVSSGFNGISSNSAATTFGKGGAAFFLGGVWNQNAIEAAGAGASGAGFTVLPAKTGGSLVAMGGVGMGWSVPSGSKHKDAAAAYINFISNTNGMKTLEKNHQLPAVPTSEKASDDTLTGDILSTWSRLTKDNGLVPYMDWSTSTFYDTIVANMQSLMGGEESSSEFTKALQTDYSSFAGGK